MPAAATWEIDRIAAHKLLVSLNIEPAGEQLAGVAKMMAGHREQSMLFAAERIQSHLVRQFEAEGPRRFERESEDWARGFNYAEELLLTATPTDLLEIAPSPRRSKGQHLRNMIRTARKP